MVMIRQSLTNAAREGCRTAVLATTTSSAQVEAAVRNYLQSVTSKASNTTAVRVTTPGGLSSCASGTELAVYVEVDYRDVSWLPLNLVKANPKIGARQTGSRE